MLHATWYVFVAEALTGEAFHNVAYSAGPFETGTP